MDEGQRDRLVSNVVGHLKNGVSEPVLQRAFEYWRNVDSKDRRAHRGGGPKGLRSDSFGGRLRPR